MLMVFSEGEAVSRVKKCFIGNGFVDVNDIFFVILPFVNGLWNNNAWQYLFIIEEYEKKRLIQDVSTSDDFVEKILLLRNQ